MSAHYSKKPLAERLGIKQGVRMVALNAPQDYSSMLGELPDDVTSVGEVRGPLDLIHFFAKERRELSRVFPILRKALSPSGAIWISWPKQESNLATDLSESSVRKIGLKAKLADSRVCSIDDVWSGLKFTFRVRGG